MLVFLPCGCDKKKKYPKNKQLKGETVHSGSQLPRDGVHGGEGEDMTEKAWWLEQERDLVDHISSTQRKQRERIRSEAKL